jgi:hypothetical protein
MTLDNLNDSEIKDSVNADRWSVVAVSLEGTSHQKRDLLCQDAHYWQLAGDWCASGGCDGWCGFGVALRCGIGANA